MPLQSIKFVPSAPDINKAPVLQILDQLLLPHQEQYLTLSSAQDAHSAIKSMRVRGAPAIAIVAALSLAVEISTLLLEQKLSDHGEEVSLFIKEKLKYLVSSRPTAVNLADAAEKLGSIVNGAVERADQERKERSQGAYVVEVYSKAAEKMLIDDVRDNMNIGDAGAQWLLENTEVGRKGHGLKVLTHCNTGSLATAGYGTALGVIRSLHAKSALKHAFCTETRPYNQGARLTAYELVHDGIPATLITDSMAGALLKKEAPGVGAVVVGADRVAANGDTANKVGTFALAVLARYHGIKFLVAAPRTSIDRETSSGSDIVIEERPHAELANIKGPQVVGAEVDVKLAATVSIAAPGISVWNPAFDVTPAELIDGIATEVGVIVKNEEGKFNLHGIFES